MRGYTCRDCEFKLWLPVADLQVSSLGLYDDARFPGRCLLVFHRHEEHLTDLSASEACAFLEDARRAATAVMASGNIARVNYAVLGNTQPHLHMHLIPRREDEPDPQRPPWEHPDPARPLPPDDVDALMTILRTNLPVT